MASLFFFQKLIFFIYFAYINVTNLLRFLYKRSCVVPSDNQETPDYRRKVNGAAFCLKRHFN